MEKLHQFLCEGQLKAFILILGLQQRGIKMLPTGWVLL